jgi:hypothetical protein
MFLNVKVFYFDKIFVDLFTFVSVELWLSFKRLRFAVCCFFIYTNGSVIYNNILLDHNHHIYLVYFYFCASYRIKYFE